MRRRLSHATPNAEGEHADPAECRDDADPLIEPRASCKRPRSTKSCARGKECAERYNCGREAVPSPSTLAACRGAQTSSDSRGRYSEHHRHRAQLVHDTGTSALHHAVGDAGRVAIDRIGGPDRRTDQSQTCATEQQGRPGRTGRGTRAAKARCKHAGQCTAHQEVAGLYPACPPESERAHRLAAGAVVTTSSAFYQRRADEQWRHHHTAADEEPRCFSGSWSFHRRGAYSRQLSNDD